MAGWVLGVNWRWQHLERGSRRRQSLLPGSCCMLLPSFFPARTLCHGAVLLLPHSPAPMPCLLVAPWRSLFLLSSTVLFCPFPFSFLQRERNHRTLLAASLGTSCSSWVPLLLAAACCFQRRFFPLNTVVTCFVSFRLVATATARRPGMLMRSKCEVEPGDIF